MKPLTYYIDKFITAVYLLALAGGIIVCMPGSGESEEGIKKNVNIRYVAAVSSDMDYMTADDFLAGEEKAADREDIREYLEKLKRNGLIEQEEEEDEEAKEAALDSEDDDASDMAEDDAVDESDELVPDPDDWRLMLVNKQNPVPEGFEPELANINGSMYADRRIINDIYKMMDAAAADGVDLMICSAYRSYDRQKTLFNNKINKLMKDGMTYLEAYRIGSMNVTVPGTSEHHIGLALDILTGSYTAMDDGFGETEAGIWLAKNAADYGFILRYPSGKEEITGIVYEPWHFRYVGTKYSKYITEQGICLEEFLKGGY
ncbi:MAG: M15 family metallopeptidase [Lachnospiraceae bacterium]|nr:M15 family metallopeptidase [Lachnospiraceae bacterium]